MKLQSGGTLAGWPLHASLHLERQVVAKFAGYGCKCTEMPLASNTALTPVRAFVSEELATGCMTSAIATHVNTTTGQHVHK